MMSSSFRFDGGDDATTPVSFSTRPRSAKSKRKAKASSNSSSISSCASRRERSSLRHGGAGALTSSVGKRVARKRPGTAKVHRSSASDMMRTREDDQANVELERELLELRSSSKKEASDLKRALRALAHVVEDKDALARELEGQLVVCESLNDERLRDYDLQLEARDALVVKKDRQIQVLKARVKVLTQKADGAAEKEIEWRQRCATLEENARQDDEARAACTGAFEQELWSMPSEKMARHAAMERRIRELEEAARGRASDASLAKDHEIKIIEEKLRNALSQREQLQQRLQRMVSVSQAAKASDARAETAEKSLDAARERIQNLEEALMEAMQTAEETLSRAEWEKVAAEESASALKADLASKENRLSEVSAQVEKLSASVANLQRSNEQLISMNRSCNAARQDLENELERRRESESTRLDQMARMNENKQQIEVEEAGRHADSIRRTRAIGKLLSSLHRLLLLFDSLVEGRAPEMDLLLDSEGAGSFENGDIINNPAAAIITQESEEELLASVERATIKTEDARSRVADKYAERIGERACPLQ